MSGSTTKRYPAELESRAVRMVAQRPSEESEWAAMRRIGPLLGVTTAETLRKWVRQAQVDAGARDGVSSTESEDLRRLRRENAELKRANAILKAASAFFAAELDRPHGKQIRTAESIAPTHPHPGTAGSTAAQWTVGPLASLVDRARDAISGGNG